MLELIGFDGDDTLWHSEGFYREANEQFVTLLERHVDLSPTQIAEHLLATEQRNLALFGYGAKGMTLSMLDTAISLTDGRISSTDIRAVLELGKRVLQHPVSLLPGIREVLENVANRYPLVLITKGDLFHQEQKVAQSGIADLFQRVEIVSEKSIATYRRILAEQKITSKHFAMVGNSLEQLEQRAA